MCKIGIYLVCDYPNSEQFLDAVSICEKYGMDFLEIGFPFSDPVADGPVIEKAASDVLRRENSSDFLQNLKKARDIFSKKLYVMTYSNVIFGYGIKEFAKKAKFINGIIIADLPFIESKRFAIIFDKYKINTIRFVTPETDFSHIDKIKQASKDFIYFVSTRGITGGKFSMDTETLKKLEYTKKGFGYDVILGFGIKDSNDIKTACRYANGVVIGTRAVEALEQNNFEEFISSLRQ